MGSVGDYYTHLCDSAKATLHQRHHTREIHGLHRHDGASTLLCSTTYHTPKGVLLRIGIRHGTNR